MVLVNSNYVSASKSTTNGFSHLDAALNSDFNSNLGSYIFLVNFGIFIVFGLISILTDRSMI